MVVIRIVDDMGVARTVETTVRHVQKLERVLSEFKALDYYSDHRFHKYTDLLDFLRSRNIRFKPSLARAELIIF